MKLPYIEPVQTQRTMVSAFGGFNNSERCDEGESFDETNISSDLYPVLSPREPRVVFRTQSNIYGMHVNNGLAIVKAVSGEVGFYFDDVKYAVLSGTDERRMCSMGAYIIIYPDKKIFNTNDKTFGSLNSEWTGSVSFQMCKLDGTSITPTVSNTAPTNPTVGQYWIDTSVEPNSLKVWAASTGRWESVPTSYTKMTGTNIGANFENMDVVKISGVTGTYADTFNRDMAIWGKTTDSIIVTALISTTFTASGVTLKREAPDLDFFCEHDNRIWGCSSANHEIYASKQGDPKNWRSYIGTAADSYAVTVGSDGDFTGCAEHGGSVVFFKEHYIHKLYGSYPANYQLDTKPERGVQKGCENSIKLMGGVLYYKSVDGVCNYDGSFPRLISDKLGIDFYDNARAGVHEGKYYIHMRNTKTGVYGLYVLDTKKNLWHIEDKGKDYKFFVEYENRLMFYDGEKVLAEGADTSIGGTTYTADTAVSWEKVSGMIGLDLPVKKYISQFMFRFCMELGAELWIDFMYDSSGEWENKVHIKNEYAEDRRNTRSFSKLKTFELPVIPRRCDHMRIRLRGTGTTKVFSIAKTTEQGA